MAAHSSALVPEGLQCTEPPDKPMSGRQHEQEATPSQPLKSGACLLPQHNMVHADRYAAVLSRIHRTLRFPKTRISQWRGEKRNELKTGTSPLPFLPWALIIATIHWELVPGNSGSVRQEGTPTFPEFYRAGQLYKNLSPRRLFQCWYLFENIQPNKCSLKSSPSNHPGRTGAAFWSWLSGTCSEWKEGHSSQGASRSSVTRAACLLRTLPGSPTQSSRLRDPPGPHSVTMATTHGLNKQHFWPHLVLTFKKKKKKRHLENKFILNR